MGAVLGRTCAGKLVLLSECSDLLADGDEGLLGQVGEGFHTGDGPEFSRGTGSLILICPLRNAAAVKLLRWGESCSRLG